jgi:hypothetical protein
MTSAGSSGGPRTGVAPRDLDRDCPQLASDMREVRSRAQTPDSSTWRCPRSRASILSRPVARCRSPSPPPSPDSRWTRRCARGSARTTPSCCLASSGCSRSSSPRCSRRASSATRRGSRSTPLVRAVPCGVRRAALTVNRSRTVCGRVSLTVLCGRGPHV